MINGLEKVFIIYDDKIKEYKVMYQSKNEVFTIKSGIKDIQCASMVKEAYQMGLYDGKNGLEE